MCGWWVQHRLVWSGCSNGLGKRVVALEDEALGAVLAVDPLILPPDDWEGVHHMVDDVALDAVQVEEGPVQFSPQQLAAGLVPAERPVGEAELFGQRLPVDRRAAELR